MEGTSSNQNITKYKLLRCADWLHKQNSQEPKNKNVNDIQFIVETNANRKKFLLETVDDDATVPAGIDDVEIKPKEVPLLKLRTEGLHLQCEWQDCQWYTSHYDDYQRHVQEHSSHLHVTVADQGTTYSCLWDICGYKSTDFRQMVRHINYHAYHARLMAIGFNGRATLKLERCKKDSRKRNQLPPLLEEYTCMWTPCDDNFTTDSVQRFFDHVRQHINYAKEPICSWGGCGAMFPRKVPLCTHIRSHTGERVIACSHCGTHFANNRKLSDHLKRQNADPSQGHICPVCGIACATEYLLKEHSRRHVSIYACTLCDMSSPSLAQLADHVVYRHMQGDMSVRHHKCHICDHRSVTKWDLRSHIATHNKKKNAKKNKKTKENISSDENSLKSERDSEDEPVKPKKTPKKYICHMCPEKEKKIFSRGTRLTTHLVNKHGVQWPYGHSRFRYQISEDGMYRLTTTRYESLEVSKKICDGSSVLKQPLTEPLDFQVIQEAEATDRTPRQFVIKLEPDQDCKRMKQEASPKVEITVCDVDEDGNIINEEAV